MKTLTRVVLEQDDKPYLRGTPAQQTQRAKILKRTKKVKAERDARAARGKQASTRPGYSSVSDSIIPLVSDRIFMLEGKYKDQRMAAERGEAKGALRGPVAKAAIRRLKGSKGKVVKGKVKRATSKAARDAYRRAARSEAGTSKPHKAPEDSLPQPRGGIEGSTEANQKEVGRRQ